ncbi:hypothetical protein [Azospirillum doebereinerae]|uniref:Uncharacterized protein n=1 Tax=Azospirillum doebereinerae TaxID=92933 RepID=A0A3S0UY07_9PROT|nr:hypothetical protein [Azospirillum doebereinerae]MCG5244257.1 hypothetical protein [Azospirillum doebereinerae]RUQ62501.1 hypothetical protein EJ913_28565 [Azospirillum doebereinerae]
MPTFLPRDEDFHPIPALRLKPGGAHALAVGDASARNAAAFSADTRVIAVHSDVPAFLRTGDAAVEAAASDHFLPAGTYLYLSVGESRRNGRHSHIAALAADQTPGTLHVSEME